MQPINRPTLPTQHNLDVDQSNKFREILSEIRYIFEQPGNAEQKKEWFCALLIASKDASCLPCEFKQAIKAELKRLDEDRRFVYIDISGSDLTGCDISDLNMSQANLTDTNLHRANMSNTALTSANLTNAQVTQANVFRTDLRSAILTRTNFNGTNTEFAFMERQEQAPENDLFNADFPGASIPDKPNEVLSFIKLYHMNAYSRSTRSRL